MAQRKKKLLRRKKRDHELQSDDEEFEVATRVKDDQDTVSLSAPNGSDLHYRVVLLSSRDCLSAKTAKHRHRYWV